MARRMMVQVQARLDSAVVLALDEWCERHGGVSRSAGVQAAVMAYVGGEAMEQADATGPSVPAVRLPRVGEPLAPAKSPKGFSGGTSTLAERKAKATAALAGIPGLKTAAELVPPDGNEPNETPDFEYVSDEEIPF